MTRLWSAGCLAIVGSAAGCIARDNDIHYTIDGAYWCGQAVGARAYDEEPGDGEDIMVPNLETPPSDDFPMDCACLAPWEDEKMQLWRDPGGDPDLDDPPAASDPERPQYEALVQRVQDTVFEHCFNSWVNEYAEYGQSSCGETSHATGAPFWRRSGLGDPFDCGIEIAGTGSEGPGLETTGPGLDPGDEIICSSQGQCTISAAYVEEVTQSLWTAVNESAYGVVTSSGLKLLAVSSGDVTYRLGFRTGDVLVNVNGQPLSTLARIEYALLALVSETQFTVQVKRGTNTLYYHYTVD